MRGLCYIVNTVVLKHSSMITAPTAPNVSTYTLTIAHIGIYTTRYGARLYPFIRPRGRSAAALDKRDTALFVLLV